MNLGNPIPRINKVSILLIIAFVLNLLFSTLSKFYFTTIFGPEDFGQFKMSTYTATLISLFLGYLLNIIIAIWIYREAKKQKDKKAWTWTALALFFGLIAVVIFYLVLVIEELRALRFEVKGDQKDKQN